MTANPEITPLLRYASQYPFRTSLTGTVLLLLCFPPVGWWPLAWIAVMPWIALIAVPEFDTPKPLRRIWASALLFWAAEVYYVTIPHPLLWFAWVALFVYLSVYPVLFVWIGRKLVHGQRVPVWIAAPLAFAALEWTRAHMLTGFGVSMLSNSQYVVPVNLQICDIAGAYGLTFLMVLFASGCVEAIARRRPVRGVLVSLSTLGLVIGYGVFRMQEIKSSQGTDFSVAVIQGNIDTRFPDTPGEMAAYQKQLFEDYLNLHRSWLTNRDEDQPLPDLVIWPEGKFPVADALPGGAGNEQEIRDAFAFFYQLLAQELPLPGQRLPPMIVGTTSIDPESGKRFNSALLLNDRGQVMERYYKMHLVAFGEFVPFGKWFPGLTEMTPIGSGLEAGTNPVGFQVGPVVVSPNICFESVVSHLIRESNVYLRSLGKEPDVIVNITDDGWFYGQAVLDHHLACNVMRAVENRKPVIVAANTGLSALIQSNGEILLRGARRQSEILETGFELKPRRSLYSIIGDWPWITMAIICVIAILLPQQKRGQATY